MTLWCASEPLVLASKSAIRRQLIEAAGIPLDVLAAALDERAIEREAGSASAVDVARLLAGAKARAVAALRPGRLVLGADQTLACGRRIFSKPADRAAARAQLAALRGQTHELHTALAAVRDHATLFEHVATVRLTMRTFSDAFLESYLDHVGPAVQESVGSYQIEAAGIHLFERID